MCTLSPLDRSDSVVDKKEEEQEDEKQLDRVQQMFVHEQDKLADGKGVSVEKQKICL